MPGPDFLPKRGTIYRAEELAQDLKRTWYDDLLNNMSRLAITSMNGRHFRPTLVLECIAGFRWTAFHTAPRTYALNTTVRT